MRRALMILAAFGMTIASTQNGPGLELAGDWKASVELNGTTHQLILHVANSSQGFSATLDSLDQGAAGLKVDSIRLDGSSLRFEMTQLGARYEGEWNAAAFQFEGKFEQGARLLPMNWKRSPARAPSTQTISDEDRTYLLAYLKKTGDNVLQSIAGLTLAQWTHKPDPSRWSVAECVEHLVIEEQTLFAAITEQVVKMPLPDGQAPSGREQDERIIQFMLDRSKKVNAGEAMKPHGKLSTPAQGIAEFSKAREQSIDWVRATRLDLRGAGTPNPTFRYLDAYQYFILMSAHSARHTEQIAEVLK